jgi:hypothetical protein
MSLVAATWTGAIASVGLLLGAIFTVLYAARAFGEQRRLTGEQVKEIRQSLEDRKRDRWVAVTAQLGGENPTVRLAGVHAMADLADHWSENQQTCIDVLCAYLRMPYEPDPGENAPAEQRLAFQAAREVRHTVIQVITAHLQPDAAVSWRGSDFDVTGVVFDGGSFAGAEFSGGTIDFGGAVFSGAVDFKAAKFSGGKVDFNEAVFSGGAVGFLEAEFSAGSTVDFFDAKFSGSEVSFWSAKFSGGDVSFIIAKFSGGEVDFDLTSFCGGRVSFGGAEFSAGSTVRFEHSNFYDGSSVGFLGAEFSGGIVDFSQVRDRTHPPLFDDWDDTPPAGVQMPAGGWVSS